jgi:signal transduction histidine kinase
MKQHASPLSDPDSRLLEALASLNQVGATINSLAPDNVGNGEETLRLIVESAIRVIPGASAVIYTFDAGRKAFEPASRVSAGEINRHSPRRLPDPEDAPRPNGIGMRAIEQRRRVLSYEEPDLDVHPYYRALGVQVTACFPLIVAQQAVGALYVYLHQQRHFNRLELLMLENFVNQAAMAIYHSHRLSDMRRDLSRKEESLRRLHRAAMLISSRLRLEETLHFILQFALEVTNARYGIFRLLDKDGKTLITRAVAGEHLLQPMVEAITLDSNSIMAWVARSRQAILIPDLQAEPWSKVYYPLDASLTMRSELAVPLINASGRLEGVLNLESPEVGAFSEDDRYLLQTLATYAVAAIQEVRLLDALLDIARLLLTQPCQEVLTHITHAACELLNAADAAIWLVEGEELVMRVASGGHQHGDRIPLHGSLAGQAVLERAPVIAQDVSHDPRFHRPDLARRHRWARALIVPVAAGEGARPTGALSVYSTSDEPGRFAESEWDKKVLTCLAHYAALAVQNEQQQQALRAVQEQRSTAEMFAAVGDIASNLLHHLNNKVGTIPVRVQNIQDKYHSLLETDPYLLHNLSEIERCASEALRTVRENLSHLRPSRPEAVEVAARVAEAIQSSHLPPGVSIQTEGLERLPMVMASAPSLTFVFANLFENAVEAMQGKGQIIVRGSVNGPWIEVTVSDSGPGVPPELHECIFELNYSGRSGARPAKLGFGLWWVKTLINRLGGTITVESDGQHGATFRLRLPRGEE